MENIINDRPSEELHGRLLFSTQLVEDNAILDKVVLDIGCGYGWFELNALKRGVKSITGMEITEADLVTARKYVNSEKVTFVTGSAADMPFENEQFDTAVSWEVLEHVPAGTEEIMFKEVYRVLKPGGTFYLSTPYKSFLGRVLDPAWWLIGHRHYSETHLKEFAVKAGFNVSRIFLGGRWGEALNLLSLYFSKWVLRRRPLFGITINNLRDREYEKGNGFMNIYCVFSKPGN